MFIDAVVRLVPGVVGNAESIEAGGSAGFPWFRAGYFLRLTPCSSWPAHGVHEARRVSDSTLWISPGSSETAYLTLTLQPAAA